MNKDLSSFIDSVEPGERKSYQLEVAESYSGITINLPVLIWKGKTPGPTVFISAAVHGDEINGTGTIRHVINDRPFELQSGMLILIPVVNIQGFERHTRYMPDRRDLNRCFPGNSKGSITSRLANILFSDIIKRCDYGIDLHTASVRKTNFPHVRADMSNKHCHLLAESFATEIVMDSPGPEGCLRRIATESGCPTIILEGGEVWKVEHSYVAMAVRGISNILKKLKMVEGELKLATHQIITKKSTWLRAENGGFLQFHVAPGEMVEKGQTLSTNTGLLGNDLGTIVSPVNGIIIGMSTMPAVSPGVPVIHIALINAEEHFDHGEMIDAMEDDSIGGRLRDDLAANLHLVDLE